MRVISGLSRGRRLTEPRGTAIRPTGDMVKESIFNIIQFDIPGRAVLDLFAGTGQLGIEALSRGAASAVFVDESSEAVRLIEENLRNTGLEGAAVRRREASAFLGTCGKFDIIFLDPPYDSGFLDKIIKKIQLFDILNENGIIVCESKLEKSMPEPEEPYLKLREYRYGKVKITIYTRKSKD